MIGTRKEDPDLRENGLTGSLADFGVTYRYGADAETLSHKPQPLKHNHTPNTQGTEIQGLGPLNIYP